MNPVLAKDAYFLCVEDDPPSSMVMSLMLQKAVGVKDFVIFKNSANFMERVKALPHIPDLVLLDLFVPPHDGFEMLRMLRADPQYQHTKVIALTASVLDQDIEKLRVNGFNGAIGKPLNLSTFPDLISRVLAGETIWYVRD